MSFLPLRQLVWLTLSWKAYVGPRPPPEPVLQFLLAWGVGPAPLTVEAAARAATSARAAISAEVRVRRCMSGSSVRAPGREILAQEAARSREQPPAATPPRDAASARASPA